jgi:TPR repeat protein
MTVACSLWAVACVLVRVCLQAWLLRAKQGAYMSSSEAYFNLGTMYLHGERYLAFDVACRHLLL